MKSCPKCNRTFPDESQKFCTFDGGLLIASQTFDPNATIRATAADVAAPPPEKTTSRELPDPNATIYEPQASTVALPRNTAPTNHPATGEFETVISAARPIPPVTPPQQAPPPQAPPAAAPETVIAAPPASVPQATAPAPAVSTPLPAPKKKSKLPWIIAGVLVVLLLGAGGLVGLFFFVAKPLLEAQNRVTKETPPTTPETNSNSSTNANANTNENTNAEVTKPAENTNTDTYTPPPDSEKFANSSANLDGKLAEHYLGFTFYYPKSWQPDPKAGVPGASNFVKVERRLPPDFTQENFAVGWYTSGGTFVSDLPNYPKLVEFMSGNLSKNFPEYHKVSEGPTRINTMDAYEFRFESLSRGTEKGDLKLWGRVVFLPPGTEGEKTGATLIMLATSLAPELSGIDDVGTKGELPVILDSFRFAK
jgi:hypothetical protein